LRIHGRSTDWIGPGKGPLFGDEGTEPTEQGIWSDQSGDLAKAPSADELGFASKPDSLGVGKATGFAAQLFEENAILFLEEFDDRLPVSVHPAGDGNQEELELSWHGAKNLSKVAAAQSSMGPRLSFLVVQGLIMNRTIEIIISPAGEIQIDAVGFKGPDCEQATRFLEEALGVVGQNVKKPEYHQRGTRSNQQSVGG
jgi:hypothetical protein